MAVDESNIDGEEVYIWAAVDCEILEVLAVAVPSERSSLDALLFLEDVLDRGPWYDWPLNLLDSKCKRETWGNRPLIEAWFGLFKCRTRRLRLGSVQR